MTGVDLALRRVFSRTRTQAGSDSEWVANLDPQGLLTVPIPPHRATRWKAFRWPGRDGASALALALSFSWPSIVRTLMRDHASRFLGLAEWAIERRVRHRHQVSVITSCRRSEGRTTLALAFAMAMSRLGERVLLIDADMAAPSLSRSLGFAASFGIDDVILGAKSWGQAVARDSQTGIAVLPVRLRSQVPSAFWSNPRWSDLVARLREEFDQILFDGGPLLGTDASPVPHLGVDGVILARRQGPVRAEDWREAQQALIALELPMLGWAETFARLE